MLIQMTVREFNKILGSDAPAPGGGSVAALSGALGAELGAMVCRLSVGREAYKEHEQALKNALEELDRLADSLQARVDLDTEAFNGVMAAFKLPKGNEAEKAARTAAIQAGYKEAVQSPLSIARECLEVLRVAASILGKTNANAISDLGVAALEACTGLEGAAMNVRINLPSIKDTVYAAEIRSSLDAMVDEGTKLKERVCGYVNQNLG